MAYLYSQVSHYKMYHFIATKQSQEPAPDLELQ